jgi:hypothetical protein
MDPDGTDNNKYSVNGQNSNVDSLNEEASG